MDYKEAGVDVTAGYKAVELMKKHVKSTFDKNVLGGLGSFGGFYSIADYVGGEPVLVAGTDGVGTKLKYAFIADKHDTVGIDCVAMCVNDVVCQALKKERLINRRRSLFFYLNLIRIGFRIVLKFVVPTRKFFYNMQKLTCFCQQFAQFVQSSISPYFNHLIYRSIVLAPKR